jgi:hypothetical protein
MNETATEISPATKVTLSNGLRVANFSSPHPFTFWDETVLEACEEDRVRAMQLYAIEDTTTTIIRGVEVTDIDLRFTITREIIHAICDLQAEDDVDIILVPLPVLKAMKAEHESCPSAGASLDKLRCIRVADRVTKEIHTDRFCI